MPADIALLHVDLSVVPDSCLRLADRYPAVLNGRVHDIRKQRFSRHLVGRDEPSAGEIIIKTDCNHGGWREFRRGILESSAGPLMRRLQWHNSLCRKLARLESRRPWRTRRFIPADKYPVFADREAVPGGVWENSNLVVERFLPERSGTEYSCRHWIFFGPCEVHRRAISLRPVLKGEHTRTESLADPVPEELRVIRKEMGFDYGKFDYGIVKGQVVLYDVNRTPGTHADPQRHAQTVELLSQGLRAILDSGLRASSM